MRLVNLSAKQALRLHGCIIISVYGKALFAPTVLLGMDSNMAMRRKALAWAPHRQNHRRDHLTLPTPCAVQRRDHSEDVYLSTKRDWQHAALPMARCKVSTKVQSRQPVVIECTAADVSSS